MTKECLFCGTILIDMIDNDIATEFTNEFYQKEEISQGLGNIDDDEWDIK